MTNSLAHTLFRAVNIVLSGHNTTVDASYTLESHATLFLRDRNVGNCYPAAAPMQTSSFGKRDLGLLFADADTEQLHGSRCVCGIALHCRGPGTRHPLLPLPV